MQTDALKQRVVERVDALAERLVDVSHQIHDHPETSFEEHFAHGLLTSVLRQEGLAVTPHAFGLDTAFSATAGETGPVVAVCCEYDALPEIGHACGHNVIAAAGLGAGLAAAVTAAEAGGRVLVLGTPAEEGGNGKAHLIEHGAFDGVAAALMVHPAGAELTTMHAIAAATLTVDFHGRGAHAAASPQEGRNALDAAVLGYMNVAALRQHIGRDERVHGVFTRGGERPNVVPDHTAMEWMVRSGTIADLAPLKDRVLTALAAGAAAAGCTMEHRFTAPDYADMVDNPPLIERYRANMATLGREVLEPGPGVPAVVASTDMGNVSYVVPSLHPMIRVSPPDVSIHQRDFARWAASPAGDEAVLDGAKALAMTIVDLWGDPQLLEQASTAFAAATTARLPQA